MTVSGAIVFGTFDKNLAGRLEYLSPRPRLRASLLKPPCFLPVRPPIYPVRGGGPPFCGFGPSRRAALASPA
jgi:hypothetical protein